MSVPLRRGNRWRSDWRNHRRWWWRWWSSGRARHHGPDNGEHHAAQHESDKEFEAVPRPRLRRRASGARCALSNRLASAVILAIVDASAGNGRRCVRLFLRILAHAKAVHAR
jgi:hypothetical protein